MASSSSSHPGNEERDAFRGIEPGGTRRKIDESSLLFDVFINHRGPDVKQTVALQLYNSLTELGIHTFLDSEEKELGDSFPSTIENAIHSASAHIAIFSHGYAESPWCLAELDLMLQSESKIIPLFYGVEPSALRHIENGRYAKAFTNYEEKRRYMDKLETWKKALREVSLLAGYEISSNFNISDCQKIVSAVQKEVQRKHSLHVAKYPVGLHGLVEDFERACLDKLVGDFERQRRMNEGGEEKAQIVGIFGMGGVGKTTLAKELFNRKHSQYRRACFLFDVREAYAKNSFPSLQKKFIKDLFQEDRFKIHSKEEGKTHIMNCINKTKEPRFLIVLDDIDHVQQLDALLIMDALKKSVDSLAIITTRDAGVLKSTGITVAYNLKGMDRSDARELFCWHAFGQPHPAEDYENLVNPFLDVCGGLPLSLQVLGSHVHERDKNYWSLELDKVSKTLPRDIHQSLKISFDALDYDERQIFMDIACFFVDKLKSIAMEVWETSGWSAQHALETLKNKCLVQEIEENSMSHMGPTDVQERFALRMHDHVRDLGREMANELSCPRRLWRSDDLKHLESKGFRYILAQAKGRCFHSFFDKSMNCRVTYLLDESDVSGERSTVLLRLKLNREGFQNHNLQPCIPSWIPLQNLRCLIIYNLQPSILSRAPPQLLGCSIISKLCHKSLVQSRIQGTTQLKELRIYKTSLKEYPELSGLSNSLEKITIDDCIRLKTISGLSDLKKLIELNISSCPDIHELNVAPLSCLEKFVLNNCYSLKTVSGISDQLVELDISGCPVFEQLLVVGLNNLKRIRVDHSFKPACFQLDDCRNLETITGILNVEKLVSINIRNCPKLELLPSLEGPGKLETVTIDGCVKLNSLHLSGCQNLKRVTGKFDLGTLFIWGCPELEALSFLQDVTRLETSIIDGYLNLDSNQKLKSQNLKQLCITDCSELEGLRFSALQTCLEKIRIVKCRKMQNITLPTKFVELSIEKCRELKTVALISNNSEFSSVAQQSCLKQITVQSCDKLQTIQGINELNELESLKLSDCPNLEELSCSAFQTCLEKISIVRCGKMQKIILPTKLVELVIEECKELKIVVVVDDQTELSTVARLNYLKRITIQTCNKLHTHTYLEKISIVRCGKLENITLPTKLVELRLEECAELKTVAAICDHSESLELQELSSATRPSCLKQLTIQSCDKLQSIQGIDELHALKKIQLLYCSNAAIQNCIRMLKSVPPKLLVVIERAVDGALSTLKPHLISDADALIEDISTFTKDKLEKIMPELSAVILCFIVVGNSSQAQMINEFLAQPSVNSRWPNFRLPAEQAEHIITIVTTKASTVRSYNGFFYVLVKWRILKEAFGVGIKKGKDWKTELHTIIDRLHRK